MLPAAAATPERLARLRADVLKEKAERSLYDFGRQAWDVVEPTTPFLDNWHHRAICDHLEAVTRGELTRLLINMPPRYGKSFWCSIAWPAWEWLRRPGERWTFCSYSASLSSDHSVARRLVIQSDWYRGNWGGRFYLVGDQNLKTEFRNSHRGVMLATSVGGSATGKGGNRIVVDDVHNPEQAESDTERGRAIRFFDSTLYSRINDKALGAFVIVMQRLHEDDLAGHLERQGGWTILRLEGRAEHDRVVTTPAGRTFRRELGEPLWPEREDAARLDEAERVMSPYVFAGQYQQRPAPVGGGMIKAERLQVVEAVPALTRLVRYWDKAGTAGGGKRTAGVLMALGVDRRYYILDVVKGQWSAGRREEVMLQTARLDGPAVATWHEQEPGSGGKESAENTNLNLAGFDVHAERVTGNKADRARPFAAQVEAGNVLLYRRPGLPPEQDWTRDFIGEARLFPNGRFLDQIDGAGGAFNKIALAPVPGRVAVGGRVEEPTGVL